jgi:nascent polypeptide-associated complex subunit beta
LSDLLPGIMNQLGAENVWSLKNLAKTLQENVAAEAKGAATTAANEDDDDVPQLVGTNFEEASKQQEQQETTTQVTQPTEASS